MGFTTVRIMIMNPADRAQSAQIDLLADTGAGFSIIPRTLLEKIGIPVEFRRAFTLANGERISREVGNLLWRYNGDTSSAPVIFGEASDKPLLGVVTLEALGLRVNPNTQKVEPEELLLL